MWIWYGFGGFFLEQFFARKVNSVFVFWTQDLNFKVFFCSFITLSSNNRLFCVYISAQKQAPKITGNYFSNISEGGLQWQFLLLQGML